MKPSSEISTPQNKSGRFFALTVGITYLLPAVIFSLLTFIFPAVAPAGLYLITAAASLIWLTLGLCGLRVSKISLASIGFTREKAGEAAWMTLLVWCMYLLLALPQILARPESLSKIFESPLPVIFLQWLFVGLGEEMLFRGYMLTWLRGRFAALGRAKSTTIALILANLIFATIHISQRLFQVAQGEMTFWDAAASILFVFALGLLFSYAFLRTGNIFLAAMMHGGNNAPLLGAQQDFMPLILFILVIEAAHFIRQRRLIRSTASA